MLLSAKFLIQCNVSKQRGGWTHTLLQNFQAQKRNVRNCDSHRIWMGKYFGTLLPPVQGNKSVLHLASRHPDATQTQRTATKGPPELPLSGSWRNTGLLSLLVSFLLVSTRPVARGTPGPAVHPELLLQEHTGFSSYDHLPRRGGGRRKHLVSCLGDFY